MANHCVLCSHGNYNLEGNVRGLELEREELARPVTVGFLVAMAFKLGSHIAKLREPYIQNETVILAKPLKHKHMKHVRRSRWYHLFC